MKTMSISSARETNGGASKYVYCPICKYKYKCSLFERLFRSDSSVRGSLQSTHGLLRNIGNSTQSVHK